MYYRLLANDIDSAKRVIDASQENSQDFVDMDEKLVHTLFNEFNTLSVIYEKPAAHFITTKELVVPDLGYEEEEAEEEAPAAEAAAEPAADPYDMGMGMAAAPAAPAAAPMDNGMGGMDSGMGGMDDFMNFGMPAAEMPAAFTLDVNPVVDKNMFQQKWMSLPEAHVETFQIPSSPSDPNMVAQTLMGCNIATVANGYQGQVMKLFLVAQHNGQFFGTELLIVQNNCKITVKTEDSAQVNEYVEILKGGLNAM